MGIDYSGGMIVGENGSEIPEPEDISLSEWAEDNDMTSYSLHYDADDDSCIYGFEVPNVLVSDIDGTWWLEDVKAKAAKFKMLTGLDARLIGTQNIY